MAFPAKALGSNGDLQSAMRLLVTADLHYNHAASRPLAEALIDQMNAAGGDVLLVIGDAAGADGDDLERCLGRFRFAGPKLFIAGNHELWTLGPDSYGLFREDLPRRVRELGWRWLQTEPFVAADVAVVGSIGWYDYAFAPPALGIPRRFYENKVSPGAAARLEEFAHLLERTEDVALAARDVCARWNDGRYVKLHRSDAAFLDELLGELDRQLAGLSEARHVVAAVHHLPFAELLPPEGDDPRDFARAYLGSPRIGEVLLKYPNVCHALCGHSHFPAEAMVRHVNAVNIGSGYKHKASRTFDLP